MRSTTRCCFTYSNSPSLPLTHVVFDGYGSFPVATTRRPLMTPADVARRNAGRRVVAGVCDGVGPGADGAAAKAGIGGRQQGHTTSPEDRRRRPAALTGTRRPAWVNTSPRPCRNPSRTPTRGNGAGSLPNGPRESPRYSVSGPCAPPKVELRPMAANASGRKCPDADRQAFAFQPCHRQVIITRIEGSPCHRPSSLRRLS